MPSTGSWSSFTQSVQTLLSLPAGQSLIRVSGWDNSAAFNIRGIRLTAAGSPAVATTTTPTTTTTSSGAYPFAGQRLYIDPYSQSAR